MQNVYTAPILYVITTKFYLSFFVTSDSVNICELDAVQRNGNFRKVNLQIKKITK